MQAEQFVPEGPQPLIRETAVGMPYPVSALGPLEGAVRAVQGMTLAPIAIPAQSALAVASLAIQGLADVETLGGIRPLSLYALTIAASGERKSSCDAPLMAALREYEREQSEAYRHRTERWKNEHARWRAQREGVLGKTKTGKFSQEEADRQLAALGQEPEAPASPDRTVTEPTYEGLVRMFATGQPSLGIFSDEGGQFLGGHAMQAESRQKTLAALNDLWMGNPIRRTRLGEGSYTLRGRRLAVHLMVQPSVARAFMADPLAADTGFLPRFLICEPESTIGTRLQSKVRPDVISLQSFAQTLGNLLSLPMPKETDGKALKPRLVKLDRDARSWLTDFADEVELKQAKGGEYSNITGYASKAAEQAARIAGVLTVWADPTAEHVSLREMKCGCELARFYLGEAVRLADTAIVSTEIDHAERLRAWLHIWPQPDLTLRDVVRNGPNRLRDAKQAKAAILTLERHGWLLRLDEGALVRGRNRKEAWSVVRQE
ncbi:MAG: hypothetical protein RL764_168 [Pseudomonadota bacterium]|jgi:hypothetical protein